MTTPSDLVPAPESAAYLASAPSDEVARSLTPFQEINERRARVENAELLQHLRGL